MFFLDRAHNYFNPSSTSVPTAQFQSLMSSDLDRIVQIGHFLIAIKYYWCATGAVFFYDYLLTLADEIKYVWSKKKSFGSWLFILNRYFPVAYQLWQFVVSYGPRSVHNTEVCKKTSFYPALSFGVCTLFAQAVLTHRIYGVTMGNVPITAGFAIAALGQLMFGLYVIVVLAKGGARNPPPIPLDTYNICLFTSSPGLEGAYAGIALLFDLFAFAFTLFIAARSEDAGLGIQIILRTIAEDTTRYFFFILASHLMLVLDMALYTESRFLAASAFGNLVFLPVMISRLFLSLRKAADSQPNEQSPPGGRSLRSMVFASPRGYTEPGTANTPLDTYRSAQGTSC